MGFDEALGAARVGMHGCRLPLMSDGKPRYSFGDSRLTKAPLGTKKCLVAFGERLRRPLSKPDGGFDLSTGPT